jgi:hypothetical protein
MRLAHELDRERIARLALGPDRGAVQPPPLRLGYCAPPLGEERGPVRRRVSFIHVLYHLELAALASHSDCQTRGRGEEFGPCLRQAHCSVCVCHIYVTYNFRLHQPMMFNYRPEMFCMYSLKDYISQSSLLSRGLPTSHHDFPDAQIPNVPHVKFLKSGNIPILSFIANVSSRSYRGAVPWVLTQRAPRDAIINCCAAVTAVLKALG